MPFLSHCNGASFTCASLEPRPRKLCIAQIAFSVVSLSGAGREGTMRHKKSIPAAWSPRRTRYDPPGLDEAIAAAHGLTDRVESQVSIAAQLIGLPEDEVRGRVLMVQAQPRRSRLGFAQGR